MDRLFDITTFETRTGVVLRLVGELDISTVALLQEVADRLIRDEPAEITVDLRELAFMDSSGLHAMLALRGSAETHGATLIVVPAPDAVMRIVRIAGVEDLFRYVDELPRPMSARSDRQRAGARLRAQPTTSSAER
jgi:anti-sigma B factor antagonist